MNDEARARSLLRRYYGFQASFSLLFWVPVFYEFQRRIGLGDERIFAIQSFYQLAFLACELPTGYLADRFGHRGCLRAGALVLLIGNTLPVLAPSSAGMVAHYALMALARSLVSGASSAYVFERLAEMGEKDRFKQVEGRARALGLLARVGGWALVGPAMEMRLTLPYELTALSASASFGFALLLPPRPAGAPAPERGPSPSPGSPSPSPSKGLGAFARSPLLWLLVLQGVAAFVLARVVQIDLFQPLLRERGVPASAFGAALAATSVFEAIGAAFPDVVRKAMRDIDAVFALTAAMAGCMVAISLGGAALALASLSLFALLQGLCFPIQRQVLIGSIPDERYRATVLSLESVVDRATSALVALGLGAAVASGQTGRFLQAAAAVSLLSVLALFWAVRRFGRAQ